MRAKKSANTSSGVYPVERTEAHVRELRALCRMWRDGSERFWGFDDVLEVVSRQGNLSFYAADKPDGSWQGLILTDIGPYSADLLYVYVRPEARRTGTGRLLVEHLCAALRGMVQIEALFLEVRAANTAAQELYRSFGMEQIGLRRGYYADGEDALVFRLSFTDDKKN